MPFEYRVITDSLTISMDTAEEREAIMNRMGAEGWRFVQYNSQVFPAEMIFMREKPGVGPTETK